MTKKVDDPEGRAAARVLYERTRGARERARKGAEIVDTQKRTTEPVADTTTPVKRMPEAALGDRRTAGAELHQIVRSAGRSLREIGARVRMNRYRFN